MSMIYFLPMGEIKTMSHSRGSICKEKGIGLIEGLGDKIQSSSWLLKK